jgi:tryptophanyl-tRNA synthetase
MILQNRLRSGSYIFPKHSSLTCQQTKINKYAFSGGQVSIEDHRRLGGNPDVDVSYVYLTYFEDDDAKLEEIYRSYKSGALLTGELKKMAIEVLQEFVQQFQEQRKLATDEVLEQFMRPRKLQWRGNPNPVAKPPSDSK